MIGFLVDNGNDQNMLTNVSQLSAEKRVHVFSSSLIPSMPGNVLQRYEAYHFNGTIVTDSFRLCQQLPHLGYCKNRFYYIKDYAWETIDRLPYRIMKNTLLNPNVDLIVNDVSQVKLIEEITNKEVKYVMNNWDINVLRQIADE